MKKNSKRLTIYLLTSALTTQVALSETALPSPKQTQQPNLPPPATESLPQPKSTEIKSSPIKVFDAELFEVAFNTYLANKDVKKAYDVAQSAVAADPTNLYWREKFANVALWNSKPRVALNQWRYIVTHQPSNNAALDKAISLANQLKSYDYLIDFYQLKLKKPLSKSIKIQIKHALATAYAKAGDPESAIELLQQTPASKRAKINQLKIIRLYEGTYEPKQELNAIDTYAQYYGLTPKLAMKKAKIQINSNDISGAYHTLNAFRHDKITSVEFWNLLATVAWKANHPKTAANAYEHLYHLKSITEAQIDKLIYHYETHNPQKAFQFALIGYELYKTKSLFERIIYLGLAQHKTDKIHDLISQLTPQQKKEFGNVLGLYIAETAYYRTQKDWAKVTKLYETSTAKWPLNNQIKIDFLWFLIDHKDTKKLRYYTLKWQHLGINNSIFWNVYGSAYMALKNKRGAFYFYQKLIQKEPSNYRWYMGASASLSGNDLSTEHTNLGALSSSYRKQAWRLLKKALAEQKRFNSAEEANIYAYLSMQFASADYSSYLMQNLKPDDGKSLNATLMDMLFHKKYAQMAHLLLAYYHKKPINIDNWIHLRLALIDGDTDQMAKLLQDHFDTLPERDRVVAAEHAGQPRLALQLAFKGLEKKPHDNDLFNIYKNLFFKYPNKWQITTGYRGFTGIGGVDIGATYQQFIGFHSSTIFKTSNWFPSIKDTNDIARSPKVVHVSEISMKRYMPTGKLLLGLGVRHAFKSNPMASIGYEYTLSRQIQLTLEGGYNQPATDSVPLRLIGLKDSIDTRLGFTLTPSDNLSLRLGYDLYYGEDQSYLGDSLKSELYFEHAFCLSYPDPRLALSISNNTNHANSNLSPFILSIAPPTVDPRTYFVPNSSTSFNIIFNIGMQYFENYTHRWRPFASISGSYNTLFSFGYGLTAGIAGTVIGRDHLALFVQFEKNAQEGGGEPTLYTGSKYTYYF